MITDFQKELLAAKKLAIEASNRVSVLESQYLHENKQLGGAPTINSSGRFYQTAKPETIEHKRGELTQAIIGYIRDQDKLVTTSQIFNGIQQQFIDKDPAKLRQFIKDIFSKDKKKVFKSFVSFQVIGTNRYLYGLSEFLDTNGELKGHYVTEKIKGPKPL